MISTWKDRLAPGQVLQVTGLQGGSLPREIARLRQESASPVVVVCDDTKSAAVLTEQVRFFLPDLDIRSYPVGDVEPYHGLSPHADTRHGAISALHALLEGQLDIIFIPLRGILERLAPVDFFSSQILSLVRGELYEIKDLMRRLVLMGYERSSLIEDKGQFAVRGDTLDIFSPQHDEPLRLSFFDIELEELRHFNAGSQRTTTTREQAEILPCRKIPVARLAEAADLGIGFINKDWASHLKKRADAQNIPKQKRDQLIEFVHNRISFHGIETFLPLFFTQTSSLLDFLKSQTCIVNALSSDWEGGVRALHSEWEKLRVGNDHIETIIAPTELLLTPQELAEKISPFAQIRIESAMPVSQTADHHVNTNSNAEWRVRLVAQIATTHSLAPLAASLMEKTAMGFISIIVCRNELQRERVKDLMSHHGIKPHVPADETVSDVILQLLQARTPHPSLPNVLLVIGDLHEGFVDHDAHQWWLTDEEIFGRKTRRTSAQSRKSVVFSSFSDISVGDYLIHMDHGIGIYRGLVKLDFDENRNDFLLVEYLGGDKLYVPVDKLARVQRFVAEEGVIPQLDKLGGITWVKTRDKAKKAARKLARELLEIQAKRQSLTRTPFSLNTEMNEEFAAAFEFAETPDQDQAISDIMKDMDSTLPADRVICGDVGYGKTEVALRAAFRAVMDGRQVAVLVPTTVLAFQHHQTFVERLKNYPVRTELLSRFRSEVEQKEVLQKLAMGQVDIVIATHRLLSKDVKFTNLGLLIIDEEHRFGVIHKEKIKKLKTLVDVLTLTATPIPRTLNFALSGIRDLSIINTPPVDRLAVRTYSCYADDITIRDALLKELRRGGQAYYVYNRVQTIERITSDLKKLLPEARIRFAHGQMEEGQLEKIMYDFMHHEIDILVCTTIIESGLDIPNANTMIIHRADTFGLSQLYQLRGRIGRSHVQAYCYLVIPHESTITETAHKRLAAIQRFTELGSGFKIASYDLEIRGAGNILGDEQSGHIASIGYDLYVQMLEAAVAELKHQHIPEDFEPEIKLSVASRIPEEMIPDTQLRLILYKQISSSTTLAEVDELQVEWEDRFGRLPPEVHHLFALIKIRILCKETLTAALKQSGQLMVFSFHPHHCIDTHVLAEAIKRQPKKFAITRDGHFSVKLDDSEPAKILAYLIELLGKFKASTRDHGE